MIRIIPELYQKIRNIENPLLIILNAYLINRMGPKIRSAASVIYFLGMLSCSHAPHHPADPAVVTQQLSDRLKQVLINELKQRSDLKNIKDVEITNIEVESDGSRKMGYRVLFESDSKDLGEVSHSFEGVAKLVEKSEDHWEIGLLERKSQELIFHQPASVVKHKK